MWHAGVKQRGVCNVFVWENPKRREDLGYIHLDVKLTLQLHLKV